MNVYKTSKNFTFTDVEYTCHKKYSYRYLFSGIYSAIKGICQNISSMIHKTCKKLKKPHKKLKKLQSWA